MAAALLAPELGAAAAAGIGLVGAAVGGAVAWAVLAPLARHAEAARRVAARELDPADFPDGPGSWGRSPPPSAT
ncbi:hypothetical protein [Frigoriglobus tundricola]|uniref:Uncharacterized protein n=1 Tax=Frigoriglobus tundricola TaxID=2774151 RepID=A0A6M5YUS8_9BACT|nr:hypothetical protein [Frigoriglobus tundricola]QJW97815.1 hypothetical protein FTUN_5395 [Frigoriglobus tundricola]